MSENIKPQMKEKIELVAEIKEKLSRVNAFYVAKYEGLTVEQISKLRKELRASNTELVVLKNTMVKRAIAEAHYAADFTPLMKEANVVAFSYADPSAAAKAMFDFAGTNDKLVVKGCLFENQFFGPDKIAIIKDLPSKETLLSMLASVLNEPMAKIARTLEALRAKKEETN